MRPISLQKRMNSTTKQNLDKKWATLFYEANIPFNVAYHAAFIDAMKSTSENKIIYKLLSYHLIQTKLLKNSKNDLSRCVADKIKNSIHLSMGPLFVWMGGTTLIVVLC
jgi:hypothetical protein